MNILPTQDIALPDLAALQRCDMSDSNVIHMGKIEAGVDKARHASGRCFHDDARSRRRLDVTGTDWSLRIDHHYRKFALSHQFVYRAFRNEFASLIGGNDLALIH